MSLHAAWTVSIVECRKLAAQMKAQLVIAACVVAPFVFAAVMRIQSSLPEDTLFGRSVKSSGFALPLVVLGFSGLWAIPVLASVVAGDMFSAEDRYGTWTTLLLRGRSRREVFLGKTAAALAFALAAVGVLAISSIVAGVGVIGSQPLIGLSGQLLEPAEALLRVAFSWLSVLPGAVALTGVAVLVSVATRSSVAGIGLPVLTVLAMQLSALVDGPETLRRVLITSGFVAWHGLMAAPSYYMPLVHACLVSSAYGVVSLTVAYRLLQRRDVGR